MSLRVVKVDDFQFLLCVKYGVWGSNKNIFKKWNEEDYLAFTINKRIAALAQVSGNYFTSDEILWDNGLYPYRIPINFIYILSLENRIPVNGLIKDIFVASWGNNYGCGILNQNPIRDEFIDTIINEIKKKSNDLQQYIKNLDQYICDTEQERQNEYLRLEDTHTSSIERKFKTKLINI
jgi:Syntaxin.